MGGSPSETRKKGGSLSDRISELSWLTDLVFTMLLVPVTRLVFLREADNTKESERKI